MIRISNDLAINKPVQEVFAYVVDLSNDPAWHTDIVAAQQTSDGAIGSGTTFHIRFKPFMGQSEGDVKITEYRPLQRVVYTGSMGPLRPTVSYSFGSAGSGTQIGREIEMQPTGWLRLMEPVMRMMMGGQNAQFLRNLKQVLEKTS